MSQRKLISIITPVYNEEKNIDFYYERMTRVLDELSPKYDFEIIFTDNCSSDSTFAKISEIAKTDKRIKVLSFSQNYGYQRSIFTGYLYAIGDAAVEFDCDLQDPPELLVSFLDEWEKGNKIVYGIRKKRQEGPIILAMRKIFYRFLNAVAEHHIPLDAGDFMLLDRTILGLLKQIDDQDVYIRGTVFSFGFKQVGIPYERDARQFGDSKFPVSKLVRLAMDGIISQSTLPLKVATYFGVFIAFLTLIASGGYVLAKFLSAEQVPEGFTTVVVLILLGISVNAVFIGVLGEYLSRVYGQVRQKPFVIIEKSFEDGTENSDAVLISRGRGKSYIEECRVNREGE